MPVSAERLNNTEPIVIFNYEGEFTSDMFEQVLALNTQYIEEVGEPIYVVADMRQMEPIGFAEMMKIMQKAMKDNPGSAYDEDLKMLVFVGSPEIIHMYRDSLQNRAAKLPMTFMNSMEEALETLRIQIKINKRIAERESKT